MANTDNAILKVEDITAGYGEMDILHNVFAQLQTGEMVCIIGPNGAGKSTLLKTIFGFLKPRSGRVILKDQDITGTNPDKIVKKGISYVPQVENVFPSMTIQENLEMGAFIRNDDFRPRLSEIFQLFPILEERKHEKVGHLSGGQRQMVAMGRALMLDPQILLLDEPSAGLAPQFVAMIFQKIKDINATGVAVILVEQNAKEALSMADRGYILVSGRNALDGEGRALLEDAEVGRLYLGG